MGGPAPLIASWAARAVTRGSATHRAAMEPRGALSVAWWPPVNDGRKLTGSGELARRWGGSFQASPTPPCRGDLATRRHRCQHVPRLWRCGGQGRHHHHRQHRSEDRHDQAPADSAATGLLARHRDHHREERLQRQEDPHRRAGRHPEDNRPTRPAVASVERSARGSPDQFPKDLLGLGGQFRDGIRGGPDTDRVVKTGPWGEAEGGIPFAVRGATAEEAHDLAAPSVGGCPYQSFGARSGAAVVTIWWMRSATARSAAAISEIFVNTSSSSAAALPPRGRLASFFSSAARCRRAARSSSENPPAPVFSSMACPSSQAMRPCRASVTIGPCSCIVPRRPSTSMSLGRPARGCSKAEGGTAPRDRGPGIGGNPAPRSRPRG
jgi:hypothetical protein